MTWTYNVALLQSKPLFQARFLIGDTIENDPQLQDEEIDFTIATRGSIWGAAAMACRSIATLKSRLSDTVTGELRTMYSSQAKAYNARAAQYEDMAAIRSGALPIVGGVSITEKVNQETDPDRVSPNFNNQMQDNLNYPLPPAGNEPSVPTPNTGINGPSTV